MSDLDPTTGRKTASDPRQHFRMAIGSFTKPGKLADITDAVERMLTKGVHAACIDWSIDNGTDGHVLLEEVCHSVGLPIEYGKSLIAHGMCHQADHDCLRCPQPRAGHVYVHDILEHNRTAAQEKGISQKRRIAAAASHQKRWGNRAPQAALEGPKRGPGRPRKSPLPELPATPLRALEGEVLPALEAGTANRIAEVEPIPARETEEVLQHPAEERARKRGRPRRTAPREWAPEVVDLCERLANHIAQNDPDGKKPTITERWRNACRLLIEKDERTPEQIARAIDWCQNDEFWRANILSMPTLREKYRTLQQQAQRGRGVRRATTQPAALAVTGMAGMLARQMGSAQGGMVKGA
jgi:hypothetical protein